jgi:hypothetical protein
MLCYWCLTLLCLRGVTFFMSVWCCYDIAMFVWCCVFVSFNMFVIGFHIALRCLTTCLYAMPFFLFLIIASDCLYMYMAPWHQVPWAPMGPSDPLGPMDPYGPFWARGSIWAQNSTWVNRGIAHSYVRKQHTYIQCPAHTTKWMCVEVRSGGVFPCDRPRIV